MKEKDLIKRYYLTEEDDIKGEVSEDKLAVIRINLDAVKGTKPDDNMSELEGWIRLIAAESYEEACEVVNKSKNPLLKEALEELMEFTKQDFVQEYCAKEREERKKWKEKQSKKDKKASK